MADESSAIGDPALRRLVRQVLEHRMRESCNSRGIVLDHPEDRPTPSTIYSRLLQANAIGCLTDDVIDALCKDALRETPCVQAVREWYESRKKPLLFFCGKVGTGKTVAAAYAIAKMGSGVFVTAHRLLRVFSGRFGASIDQQDQILRAGVLVVDDVGREPADDRAAMMSALVEVLSDRQSWARRTILTTNLDSAEFSREYKSPPLRDRIFQLAKIMNAGDVNLRRQKESHDSAT